MPIVEVDHVTKEFQLGQLVSLKQSVVNGLKRVCGRPVAERKPFKALDDVSFSVEKEEVVGIIGHNGAGKSTLLKLLAGISKPTAGRVSVIGKVAPLIEVGAGMVPDLTGRENIHLNCAILGIPKRELARKFDEIVSFAELEEFIDTPVKRYSSGMKVKLGFAVATSIEAEILILDEVLAVGDLAFQRKCFDRMDSLIRNHGKTVLLVSHNIRQVERICTRVIMLEHGRVLSDGNAREVCNLFYEQTNDRIVAQIALNGNGPNITGSGDLELQAITLLDAGGRECDRIEHDRDATLMITFRVHNPLKRIAVGLGVHTPDLLYLATADSIDAISIPEVNPGLLEIRCRLRRFPLWPGTYSFRIGVAESEFDRFVFYGENLLHFQVVSSSISATRIANQGFFPLRVEWAEVVSR